MPVNACYSERRGGNWEGFNNDWMTSFKVAGGCCRFYEHEDCMREMFMSCGEDSNVGNAWNDKLSSVFCWL
ncbi:hypothetical protein BS50DRAFT_574938 [Corynespora cassiicola Philippines]|uniref:Uncharacterized protein n=1 Tax=Corynespora cassiicola Philippines TaxID=1448308 RepID=A0A2T2NMN5_CORCC|nr:hypothetical protein BS50DRAFT_574938 [Corynespora cassiicola Philippines]